MQSQVQRKLSFDQAQHQTQHSTKICYKCMCQICTCGKHKCPPPMKEYEPFMEKESQYKQQFRPQTAGYSNQDRKQQFNQIKQKHVSQIQLDHPDPGETYKTIQQENLQCLPKGNTLSYEPSFQRGSAKMKKLEEMSSNPLPHGEFQGMSRQKLDYRRKKPEPTECFRPNLKTSLWENETQNDYSTTYKSNIKSIQRSVQYEKPQVMQKFNKSDNILSDCIGQKFQAETEKTSQFCLKNFEKVEPIRPTNQRTPYAKESGRMVKYDSAYKKDYKYIEQQRCPIYDLPQAPRAPSPGRDHIYYNKKMESWE